MTAEGTGCHSWAALEEPGRHSPGDHGTEESAALPHSTFPSPTASLRALCCERCQSATASFYNKMWRSGVPELLF